MSKDNYLHDVLAGRDWRDSASLCRACRLMRSLSLDQVKAVSDRIKAIEDHPDLAALRTAISFATSNASQPLTNDELESFFATLEALERDPR